MLPCLIRHELIVLIFPEVLSHSIVVMQMFLLSKWKLSGFEQCLVIDRGRRNIVGRVELFQPFCGNEEDRHIWNREIAFTIGFAD